MNVLPYALIFALSGGPAVAETQWPQGLWARGDGNAQVRFEPCGPALCAVNEWVRPGTGDEKTGDRLVLSVAPDSPSRLSGSAFDPQRNATYAIRMEGGERRMTTQGCVLGGLLCKSMSWTRLDAGSD